MSELSVLNVCITRMKRHGRLSHVKCANGTRQSHVKRVNVTSHIQMRRITHTNKSCHVCKYITTHKRAGSHEIPEARGNIYEKSCPMFSPPIPFPSSSNLPPPPARLAVMSERRMRIGDEVKRFATACSCLPLYMHMFVHTHMHMYVHTHTYVCVCVYIYIYRYIHRRRSQ